MAKELKSFWTVVLFCILYFLVGPGCSATPVISDSSSLASIVRVHKRFSPHHTTGMTPHETGVYVQKGEIFSVLPSASDSQNVFVRIGNENMSWSYHAKANSSGPIMVGIGMVGHQLRVLEILVWQKEDWPQIIDVLEKLRQKDPGNKHLIGAIDEAKTREQIFLAEAETAKDTEEVSKELQTLKEKPGTKTEQAGPSPSKKTPSPSAKPSEEKESSEKIAQLEQKLAALIKKQAELEEMKESLNAERKKSDSLSKELEERQKEQEDLRTRLRLGPKTLPLILLASPNDGIKVERNAVDVSGVAEADLGLESIEISVNNKLVGERAGGKPGKEGDRPRRIEFKERIPLVIGENKIKIRAVDADGLSTEKSIMILFEESRKNIWAVVIGINDYRKATQLKYAVNDAKAFYDHLVNKTQIPRENVTLLLNSEASLSNLRSTLGTQLKNKAGTEDMVILYFAGHGATEGDVMSPDGDGLEKYLLPFDADLKDLYASALPMREISYILQRIRSERLVFIIDSCYSGASGGRTVKTDGKRASISDRFLDRVVSGKGMIIMTASGANEVSLEKEDLRHGVFTYFLLDGLEGKADTDHDGVITVDEAYDYVSKNVPKATGQEQHPVKKGAVEGQLILGIIH
jgi:hypothetical protein